MKQFIIIFLLLSNFVIAKECFKNKQSGELICYERYFQKHKLYKAKANEKYYTAKDGKIYAIKDKIEVKFKSAGAILFVLNNYEVDFVDKIKGEKYILKVRNKDELFAMLSILNDLNAVYKALPVVTQKYTKTYVEYVRKKKKEKLQKIKERLENSKTKKNKKLTPENLQGFKFGS